MGAVRDPESPYAVLYKHAFSIVKDPLVYLFPAYTAIPSRWIPYRNRARIANEKLREILYNIIQARKDAILSNTQTMDENKDLLTIMIEASMIKDAHTDEKFLTNGELASNLAVFFVAGDAPHDIVPTHDQLRQMSYLNNCIKETMRINPPTSGNLSRVASCDTHIGQTFIPKGTIITTELYCAHHLDKYWPNPHEFNPDRFSSSSNTDEENYGKSDGSNNNNHVKSNQLYIPFGYGPRACIGMNFSLAEQRVVQAMMLRKYTWQLVPMSEHEDGLKNAKSGGVGLLGPDKLYLRLMKRY
ncbi:cytochrome P450 [Phascolomyces articulosus]|uniref:Cytochrome P450 n=1 Tax=Phascolomyces articulosus TaxID=60185 RepID=A0AAD5K0N6_9FUNG|nr:cytochrome P450 [Phascolomyces articulosus]